MFLFNFDVNKGPDYKLRSIVSRKEDITKEKCKKLESLHRAKKTSGILDILRQSFKHFSQREMSKLNTFAEGKHTW